MRMVDQAGNFISVTISAFSGNTVAVKTGNGDFCA
jgi:hypothetical protein